jgi:hypothetical protein
MQFYRPSLPVSIVLLCCAGCVDRADDKLSGGQRRDEMRAARGHIQVAPNGKSHASSLVPDAKPGERIKLATDLELRMTAYTFVNGDGKINIEFENAPSNVHSLIQSPTDREKELSHGNWLVLAFAVWSETDVRAVLSAARFAATSGKRFK